MKGLLAVLVLAGLVLAPSASAALGGSISGTIAGADGAPVTTGDVCVWATAKPFTSSTDWDGASPDEHGRYVLEDLDPGEYLISYQDCYRSPRNDVKEWYDNASAQHLATPVAVRALQETRGIDVRLAQGTTISGRATIGGRPVERACVTAYPAAGGSWEEQVFTEADGTYTLRHLAPGGYKVKFHPCAGAGPTDWAPAYWRDATTLDAATVVTTTLASPATNVDIAFARASSITGTVRDTAGRPLADVCVSSPSGVADPVTWPQSVRTDANGRYTIPGLASGRYWLRFADCATSAAHVPVATDAIVVGRAEDRTYDVVMTTGASISGRVTAGGLPVKDACVTVYEPGTSGATAGSGITATDGTYRVDGLVSDRAYRVRFSGCGAHPALGLRFYDDAATLSAATPVRPTLSRPATGIDGELGPAGSISGTVTAGGAPVGAGEVCIDAYPEETGGSRQRAKTDALGRYTIPGLAEGAYAINFIDCTGEGLYVAEYWRDTPSYYDATPVTLATGGVRAGIDADLASAGAITGTAYQDATSEPARDVCVLAYPADGTAASPEAESASTAADGTYRIRGLDELAAGYRVKFTDCWSKYGFMPRFHGGDERESTAAIVRPRANRTVTGVDVRMVAGGVVSGTVRDAQGTVESGVCASASPAGTTYYGYEREVGAGGRYRLAGVPSGTYTVRFRDCAGDARNDLPQAREGVAVTAGATTDGIDATMAPAGLVSGRVVDGAGAPIADVCVVGWVTTGPASWAGQYTARTNADGRYALRRIEAHPDGITVSFAPCDWDDGWREEFYADTTEREDAVVLRPTGAAPLTGIDATLVQRGAPAEEDPPADDPPVDDPPLEEPLGGDDPLGQEPAGDSGARDEVRRADPPRAADIAPAPAPAPVATVTAPPAATRSAASTARSPATPKVRRVAGGLQVDAGCACTVSVRATVDAGTARRLGLRRRTLGTATGRGAVRLRVGRKVRGRVTVVVRVDGRPSRRTVTL